MGAFILAFLKPRWTTIAKWAGIAAAILAVAFKLRADGKNAERVATLKATLKVKNEQQKAAVASPRTRSELVDELRHGDF